MSINRPIIIIVALLIALTSSLDPEPVISSTADGQNNIAHNSTGAANSSIYDYFELRVSRTVLGFFNEIEERF